EHDPPAMTADSFGIHGLMRSANCAVLVVPWAVRPAAAWRDGVTAGIAAGAAWGLIANGRSVRIVDCTRPWSRAAIEFDFERLVISPRGVAALRVLAVRDSMGGATASLRSRIAESDAHASRVCDSLSDG